MKVSFIHGICVKNDAISDSIHNEITWLNSEQRNEIRLYVHACDRPTLPFTKVDNFRDVAFDQHFQSSDLVIFHFGVFYPLFDLLFVTPRQAKRLVVFHNITPKQFVSSENYGTIEKSFKQMANIMFADHVACDSQTNVDVLRNVGINMPTIVLPLAVNSVIQMPESKPSVVDRLIRLVFIGRFVRSKGPGELLEALQRLLSRNRLLYLSLDMIGNLSFSDSKLVEKIQATVKEMHQSYGGRIKITIHANANEEVKNQLLRAADLFVLPTYHEGFGVPIVEALASGCKVIAYENSNVPAISGGLARLTPTGDVTALSCAIADEAEKITSSTWQGKGKESYTEYTREAQKYVQQYSPDYTKRRFLEFIQSVTS